MPSLKCYMPLCQTPLFKIHTIHQELIVCHNYESFANKAVYYRIGLQCFDYMRSNKILLIAELNSFSKENQLCKIEVYFPLNKNAYFYKQIICLDPLLFF